MASPARAGTGSRAGFFVRVGTPGPGEVALVSPRDNCKTTILGIAAEQGKNRLGQGRNHLPIAAVVLTLGYDRRTVHMHPGITASPAINRIGVIEPVGTASNSFNHIQYRRKIHEGQKDRVAFYDIRYI